MRRIVAFVLLVTACGGETRDKPETLVKLKQCQDQVDKDKKSRDELASQLVELQGASKELVVRFEGDVLTIEPSKGGAAQAPLDPKVSEKLSKGFLTRVQKSRGTIQKCYEQMLKKNSALGSKTISLKIYATFSGSGEFQKLELNPAMDRAFETCIEGVVQGWKVEPVGQTVTFQSGVSLTPS